MPPPDHQFSSWTLCLRTSLDRLASLPSQGEWSGCCVNPFLHKHQLDQAVPNMMVFPTQHAQCVFGSLPINAHWAWSVDVSLPGS